MGYGTTIASYFGFSHPWEAIVAWKKIDEKTNEKKLETYFGYKQPWEAMKAWDYGKPSWLENMYLT